ncbi:CsgG/HfaB family protein [Fibrobacterota bacterium]
MNLNLKTAISLGVLICALPGTVLSQPDDSDKTVVDDASASPESSPEETEGASALSEGPVEGGTEDAGLSSDAGKHTLAVLHFYKVTGDDKYAPLEKALADMVITDLSQVDALTLVERERLGALSKELDFNTADAHSKPNQTKMASMVNTNKIVTGRYAVGSGGEMSIESSLLRTDTDEEKAMGEVSGSVEEFFKLEKKLVFSILENMGIVISDDERLKIEVIQTENLLALLAYGKGLDASDNGDHKSAAKAFSKAAEIDPGFKQASKKAEQASEKAGAQAEASEKKEEESEEENAGDPPVEILGSGPEMFPDILESGNGALKTMRRMSGVMGRSFMPETNSGDITDGKTVRTGHSDEDGGGLDHQEYEF